MAKTICFYEDKYYQSFYPLTYVRPVYLLRTGMQELFKQVARNFPDMDVAFACRSQVAPLVRETCPDIPVNTIDASAGELLFVNGRIRELGDLVEQVGQVDVFTRFVTSDNEVVAILYKPDLSRSLCVSKTPAQFDELAKENANAIETVKTTSTLYRHAWDMIADIENSITTDFGYLRASFGDSDMTKVHEHASLVNEQNVFLAAGVEICPGAIVDASQGPVYIGANTRIESHAAVYGPSYIGEECLILAGKVTGSSIGPGCRVGGEVEESVFQASVNKYHAGFIGHSYVAPWVNFGAMTTNSDLKNNYSSIRVSLNNELIDTGLLKLGSLIGDHTKFGIGTLLNTGINIGVCCNIFGGTLITDKEVPSFKWGGSDGYSDYRVDKAIETARAVVVRRGRELSVSEVELLEALAAGKDNREGVLEFGHE
ncbi:MAG: hypothetical protein KOO62_12535 [candidate division Zixibacteria bacterium]|nr:hypothetical protein [candidate division Zixibacteria bacterium]